MAGPTPHVVAQLQHTHLEKLYGYLPGLPAALPAVFGLSDEEYAEVRAGFDARAREAALELLDDVDVARRVARLPFRRGSRVLAVGDSITDDLLSWAQMLRHLLALARPEDEIEVVNAGLSGHTTAMVLRRWPSMIDPAPDWILCGLGGNDVTRVAGGKPQVTTGESVANLRELRRIAAERTAARLVWLTPVPVDEDLAAASPAFRYGASSWRNADVVALAAAVGSLGEPVVDLVTAVGVPPRPGLQGPDGVHPSVAGQQRILTAVLETLTEEPVGDV